MKASLTLIAAKAFSFYSLHISIEVKKKKKPTTKEKPFFFFAVPPLVENKWINKSEKQDIKKHAAHWSTESGNFLQITKKLTKLIA